MELTINNQTRSHRVISSLQRKVAVLRIREGKSRLFER